MFASSSLTRLSALAALAVEPLRASPIRLFNVANSFACFLSISASFLSRSERATLDSFCSVCFALATSLLYFSSPPQSSSKGLAAAISLSRLSCAVAIRLSASALTTSFSALITALSSLSASLSCSNNAESVDALPVLSKRSISCCQRSTFT